MVTIMIVPKSGSYIMSANFPYHALLELLKEMKIHNGNKHSIITILHTYTFCVILSCMTRKLCG